MKLNQRNVTRIPMVRPLEQIIIKGTIVEGCLVYSRDLVWAAQGGQAERFAGCPPQPANGNILLAKLRPGQVNLFF